MARKKTTNESTDEPKVLSELVENEEFVEKAPFIVGASWHVVTPQTLLVGDLVMVNDRQYHNLTGTVVTPLAGGRNVYAINTAGNKKRFIHKNAIVQKFS